MKGQLDLIRMISAISAGPALIVCWALYYPSGCWVLLIPLIFIAVLTISGRSRRLWRRRCVADCLFENGSRLHLLLYSSTWVTILSLVMAVMLTAALMISVPNWNISFLVAFVFDALVLAIFYLVVRDFVLRSVRVRSEISSVVIRAWAVALNVIFMVVVLFALQLQQPPPDYLNASSNLTEVLSESTTQKGSDCSLVSTLVRFGGETEALGWWLTLRATQVTQGTPLAWLVWAIFLLGGSLSLWSYSAFCIELIHRAHLPHGEA